MLGVHAGGAVTYAGSLPIMCSKVPGSLELLFDARRSGPRCSPPAMGADESELAAKIAQRSFAQYGPLQTVLMRWPQ